MTQESSEWLNTNVLVGFTEQRGRAWHYRASNQGAEPNHYPGAIPVEDVRRRLFHWRAESAPVLVDDRFGLRPAPRRQAVVASDTGAVLGVHTDSYGIHQYQDWLLDKVATLLDDDLAIGSAGMLRGRRQAWVSVEVPDTITTPEGVEFRPHLLACTSHDGSIGTTFKRVVTNVVCDNTMAAGLRERGQQFTVKHSRRSADGFAVLNARDALHLVHSAADEFAAEVRELCRTTVTDDLWQSFVHAQFPVPDKPGRSRTTAQKNRATLHRLWTSDQRVAPWRGTAWGVMQAVNTFTHHEARVRSTCRAERNMARAVDGAFDTLDHHTARTLHNLVGS